jgi:L-cystine uptake protein TcyP (sodium:dicarboxylate symporter family)
MKKIFIRGIAAGILSAILNIVYLNLYQNSLGASFDKVINIGAVIGSSIFGCMLMSVSYFLLLKFKKERYKGVLNLVIAVLSFASIMSPFAYSLPLDVEAPELFPGLAALMHLVPAMIFFAIEPFFSQSKADASIE